MQFGTNPLIKSGRLWGDPNNITGGMTMLSTKHCSIEPLAENQTALTPLTQEQLAAVEGGDAGENVGMVSLLYEIYETAYKVGTELDNATNGALSDWGADLICGLADGVDLLPDCPPNEPEPVENSWEHPLAGIYSAS
jgi:hypothetical protein